MIRRRPTPSRLMIGAAGLALLWLGVTGLVDGAAVLPSRYGTREVLRATSPGTYWLVIGFDLVGGLALLAACVKWRRVVAPE